MQPPMVLHPGTGTCWLMASMLSSPMVRSVAASSHVWKSRLFSHHTLVSDLPS